MKISKLAFLCILCLVAPFQAIAGEFHAAHMKEVGSEFQVNTMTAYDQMPVAVSMNEDGSFEITYVNRNLGTDYFFNYYVQHFDSKAALEGEMIEIEDSPYPLPTASISDGTTVRVWNIPDTGVYAQIFDAQHNPLTGQFLAVPCASIGTNIYADGPAVAMSEDGSFVIVWSKVDESSPADTYSNGDEVWAKQFDRNGNPVGKEFRVNATVTGNQNYPVIAVNGNQQGIIVWGSYRQDGDGWGVYAQRFSFKGNGAAKP